MLRKMALLGTVALFLLSQTTIGAVMTTGFTGQDGQTKFMDLEFLVGL